MEESFRVKKWVNFIPIARHYLTGLHTELSLNVKKNKDCNSFIKNNYFYQHNSFKHLQYEYL